MICYTIHRVYAEKGDISVFSFAIPSVKIDSARVEKYF